MRKLAILLIRIYHMTIAQLLGALFGDFCRFSPTCSQYAIISIEKYGVIKGSIKAAKRISQCQPFYKINHRLTQRMNYE